MTYKEVFQLAQDKGYRISFASDISDNGLITIGDYLWGDEEEAKKTHSYQQLLTKSFVESCLLQKWLRDEHKIAVLPIDFIGSHYGYKIICPFAANKMREIVKCSFTSIWATYEEALLHGVYEALKLLP